MIDVNTDEWGMNSLVTAHPLPAGIVRKFAVAPGGEELRQWLRVLENGLKEQPVCSEGLLSCGGGHRSGRGITLRRMREYVRTYVCACVLAYA